MPDVIKSYFICLRIAYVERIAYPSVFALLAHSNLTQF